MAALLVLVRQPWTDGRVPTRALVEQSLRYHDSNVNLIHSARFTAGLPADGNTNFSALVYHNLAPLVQPFANQIGNSTKSLPEESAWTWA